ncbi:ABC transporter substrate-binding protein [Paenibacillus sp. FSL R7-277]|uniref:ABC transporter substrate-binding protein n=1 Tax=Paenibacillus sp. FSL R7-277 TaxID=1227352 RepID=UPI0012DEE6D4|nr:iron-siderophore ABC transporter substrate-binding protein [Paenibacillus sp. FSL R7-277]
MFPYTRKFKHKFSRGVIGLLGVIMLGLVVGCSNSGNNGGSAVAGSTSPVPAKTAENTDTRIISTIKGDIEIPAHPKKVAGMLYVFADHLLALGIEPHAMVTYNDLGFPQYLSDQMKDTIVIGSGEAPNLEALLEAEPDLILASKTLNEANYEQLSRIAPTILFDNENEDDWTRFRQTAEIFGKETVADQVHADYESKIAAVRNELAATAATETVAYMRIQDKQLQLIQPGDNFTLFGPLGLTPASTEGIDFKDSWNVAISEEVLPELNPDRMFIILRPGDSNQTALDNIMSTSIWANLTAVKNKHVYIGDANLWFAGYGPIGLSKVIDEISNAYLPES